MAESKEDSEVRRPRQPPPFLEVFCKTSGKIRRFSAGTEAGFAATLINKKLLSGNGGGDANRLLASGIEAVKEGEEPVNFGPNSLLVDYGSGWKLQTVIESHGDKGGVKSTTRVRRASANTGVERINLADDFEAAEVPPNAPTQKIGYSDEENALLASCWIDISTDSVVGNDQRADQMWNRIAKAYNKNKPAGKSYRALSTLKSHYYTVQKLSREFNDCYIQVRNAWGSGCNDADIEEKAHAQYVAQHKGKKFKYVKAWRVLKNCPKFLEGGDVRGSKKTKISASGEYVVSSNTESSAEDGDREEPPRPMGRNAARRKAKGKGKATTSAGAHKAPFFSAFDKDNSGSHSMSRAESPTSLVYIGKIMLAFLLIFVFGAVFTLVLENLPRFILHINSSI